MPILGTTISEALSAAVEYRAKGASDNISNNNALHAFLKKNGNIQTIPGGPFISLHASVNDGTAAPNVQRFSEFDTLAVNPSQVLTRVDYNWKDTVSNVALSGAEIRKNEGPTQIINIIDAKVDAAMSEMENQINNDLLSDGTASGGKQIGGLQHLVSKTPTVGTVGGINRATATYWRNRSYSALTDFGAAVSGTNVSNIFQRVMLDLTRSLDGVDAILAGDTVYNAYVQNLQNIQRITSDPASLAGLGFTAIKYFGSGKAADVVYMGGMGSTFLPTDAYFLNTKYITLYVHKDGNFAVTDEAAMPNVELMIKRILFSGNLTTHAPKFQAVLSV
jgi:hypothetical protein